MPRKKKVVEGASPPPTPKKELTEFEQVDAEIHEISPRLSELKRNDPEEYEKVYKRFLWLVERREQLRES